jgi:hypothetical protein
MTTAAGAAPYFAEAFSSLPGRCFRLASSAALPRPPGDPAHPA